MSFLQVEAKRRLKKGNLLIKLDRLLDWEKIQRIIGKLGRSGFGPNGYPPIKMIKAILLQQ